MNRSYTWSKHPQSGRNLLIMHANERDIPFNIWRDIGRLAGYHYCDSVGEYVFEFLFFDEEKRNKVEKILHGGMWKPVVDNDGKIVAIGVAGENKNENT